MNSEETIKEALLRELSKSAVTLNAIVKGENQGFSISVRIGEQKRVLETARGQARRFASLDTAASFIKDVGIPQFEVDMSGYQPGRLRRARPDRAAALKKTRTRMKQQALEI